MIIDAHQHVWNPGEQHYPWLASAAPVLRRPIGFDELLPSLARAQVDGTILVQSADSDEDTDAMLRVAAEHPEVVGVVAYVPLHRPAAAAERLRELRANPLVVGVRNLIHDQPDPDWLLRPDVDEGLTVLENAGVPLDLPAVLPRHLELVPILNERHPRLRIVIDHLAKPPIGRDTRDPWWTLLGEAAASPLVYAKVSGLYSATADPASWSPELLRPYFDRALELFGAGRLMYGGDWPVSLIAGGYDRVWDGLQVVFSALSPSEREAVLGSSAAEFYGIPATRVSRRVAAQTSDVSAPKRG